MILAGNVALEDMGFPTFGFAGGRADVDRHGCGRRVPSGNGDPRRRTGTARTAEPEARLRAARGLVGNMPFQNIIMAGLDPAIFFGGNEKDRRDKPGDDGSAGYDQP